MNLYHLRDVDDDARIGRSLERPPIGLNQPSGSRCVSAPCPEAEEREREIAKVKTREKVEDEIRLYMVSIFKMSKPRTKLSYRDRRKATPVGSSDSVW